MIGLMKGFFMPITAIRFMMQNKKLIKFAAIPFIINIIVFTAGTFLVWFYFTGWLSGLVPVGGEGWYWGVLYYILLIVFAIVLLVFIILIFTLFGSVIASPFNDILSERTEKLKESNWQEEKFSVKLLAGDIGRSVSQEIKKLLFFTLIFGVVFLLNILPGIGSILFVFINLICTFIILAIEFIDFPLSRRRYGFRNKIRFALKHIIPVIGFGSSLFLMGMIMFVNYLLLPVAVVGGTLLYCELELKKEHGK